MSLSNCKVEPLAVLLRVSGGADMILGALIKASKGTDFGTAETGPQTHKYLMLHDVLCHAC